MIDHTGHPHPSTPKARALCRANGGTGFIGKIGAHAPIAHKSDHGTKPHVPQGPVDVHKAPPKPHTVPNVKSGPTVPKSHGVAKPTHPVPKKAVPPPPAAPPKTTAPTTPSRQITPKHFDKNKMEIKDGNGNWQKVARVSVTPGSRGTAGKYKFHGAKGNLIREASPTEKLDVREVEIPRVAVPPRSSAGTMQSYIPQAKGNSPEAKIQNALRSGASRDFIVARSPLQREETDTAIDRILTQNGVPNHVFPRLGNPNAVAPKATDVKRVTPASGPLAKLQSTGRVEAPDGPKSAHLTDVQNRITLTDPAMKARGDRVAAIQEAHVGAKIRRIRSVKTGIPTGRAYEGLENANGVCLNGHIHIHKDFDKRSNTEAAGRVSGWKVRGGDDPLETTIAHEMGHALLTQWDINMNQRRQIAEAMVARLGLEDAFPKTHPWDLERFNALVSNNKAIIKNKVSNYASTNINEFIAEVWADYTMNPKPDDNIKTIGDVIKGVVKTLGTVR